MIKNIEDLKNIQIFCIEEKDVKNCLNMLEKLGFEVFHSSNKCRIISYSSFLEGFKGYTAMNCSLENCFYNKKFIKTLQNFIKQKEEQEKEKQEKIKDIEVASDGRVIKINNKESEKQIFVVYDEAYNYDYEYYKENGMKIVDMAQNYLDFIVKYGIAYATKETRDRALFKIEIETKLKNIAERLNKGQKIDWENGRQEKFTIYYDYKNKTLCNYDNAILGYSFECFCKSQGTIYCLDENFLNVAKQEIGEDNLIKYFKES